MRSSAIKAAQDSRPRPWTARLVVVLFLAPGLGTLLLALPTELVDDRLGLVEGAEAEGGSGNDEPLVWNYSTSAAVRTVAIAANGKYIVAGGEDKNVFFFSANSSTPLWSYTTGDQVRSVAISATGEYIAAAGEDRKVYLFRKNSSVPLWSYTTGDKLFRDSVAISSDGEYIVAGGYDKKIYLFDKDSNTPLWSYTTGDKIFAVDISANGKFIAAGSGDDNVYFFEKDDSNPRWNYTADDWIWSVAISGNGEYISAGTNNDKVYLFDKNSSTPLWDFTAVDYVGSVAMSFDGADIIAGCDYWTGEQYDGKLYLFDKDNETPRWSYTTGGNARTVSISEDGEHIVAGGEDNNIYLFDKDSDTPLWSYTTGGYISWNGVDISANGEYIVAGSDDKKVYLFRNPLPDLTLDSDDITFSNASPTVGDTVTIEAVVRNVGERGPKENYLSNSGFENNLTNWSIRSGANWEITSNEKKAEDNSLTYNFSSTGYLDAIVDYEKEFSISANEEYYISMWTKQKDTRDTSNSSDSIFDIGGLITYEDDSKQWIDIPHPSASEENWFFGGLVFTAEKNGNISIEVHLHGYADTDESVVFIDEIVFRNNSVPATATARFYDGDPDDGGALIGSDDIAVWANATARASVEWTLEAAGMHEVYVRIENVEPGDGNWSNNVARKAVVVNGVWQRMDAEPSAGEFHGMVYDSKHNKMVLFGGRESDGSPHFSDTWTYNVASNTWIKKNPPTKPSARHDPGMTYDSTNNKVVLFGGHDENNCLDDTWEYDITSNIWTEKKPSTKPSARANLGMTYDSMNNKVVLFGGVLDDPTDDVSDETWVYDLASDNWTQMDPITKPPKRSQHEIVYDSVNNKIVLFGGADLSKPFGDTWIYDVASDTWTEKFPETKPSARYGYGLVYDSLNEKTVLFGGSDGVGTIFNETWEYDYDTNNWTQMNPSTKPSARGNSGMTYDSVNNKIVLFGGVDYSGDLNETWLYDYATNNWTQRGQEDTPSSRYDMGMAYNSSSQKAVLFGGFDGSNKKDDTWVYNSETNIWKQMDPSTKPSARMGGAMAYDSESEATVLFGGLAGGRKDDTWVYDIEGDIWINKNPSPKPSARDGHRMVYDSINGKLIMFGGMTGSLNDETWTYDVADNEWTNKNPSIKPSARDEFGMAFDSDIGVVVLFGGISEGNHDDETWVYDLSVNAWTKKFPSTKPSARSQIDMDYDPVLKKTVLYGGYNGSYLNETWVYDLEKNNWTKIVIPRGPSARQQHGVTFDTFTNEILIFGGYDGDKALDETWIFGLVQSSMTFDLTTSASLYYPHDTVSLTASLNQTSPANLTFTVLDPDGNLLPQAAANLTTELHQRPPATDGPAAASTVGLWRFDEGWGPTAADSSGNTNEGELKNGPQWVEGKLGKALSFDGSDDYVEIDDDPALEPAGQLALQAWIKTEESADSPHIIAWKRLRTDESSYAFYVRNGSVVFDLTTGDPGTTTGLYGEIVVSDGEWHHVMAIYDGSDMNIYVDGVLDVSTEKSEEIEYDSGFLALGRFDDPWGYYFNGAIDEVRISNVARDPSEFNLYQRAAHSFRLGPRAAPGAYTVYANVTGGGGGSSSGAGGSAMTTFEVGALQATTDREWYYQGEDVLVGAEYYDVNATNVTWELLDPEGRVVQNANGELNGWEYGVDDYTVGLWHFNEGNGNTTSDETANNNDGTLMNDTPTWVDGISGKALSFNDINHDYIEIVSDDSLNITEEITIEAWIKSNSIYYVKPIIAKSGYTFYLAIGTNYYNSVSFQLENIGSTSQKEHPCQGSSIIANEWYHVAGVRKDNVMRTYINGKLCQEITDASTDAIPTNTNSVQIGAYGGYYFNGTIDEVRISNTSRSPSEFNLFQSASSTLTLPAAAAPGDWTLRATAEDGNLVTARTFEVRPMLTLDVSAGPGEGGSYAGGDSLNVSAELFRGGADIFTMVLLDPEGREVRNVTVEGELDGWEYEADDATVGLWHFDEGDGDTAWDASGNGNDGELKGFPVITQGIFGKAYQYNGTDEYIELPGNPSLNSLEEITVEAWVNVELFNFWGRVIDFGGDTDGGWLIIATPQDEARILIGQSDGTNQVGFYINASTNRWYHVVLEISPSEGLKAYVNGQQLSTKYTERNWSNSEPSDATESLLDFAGTLTYYFGKSRYEADDDLNGTIDEVRISNVAREPWEFNLLQRAAAGLTLPSDAASGNWTVLVSAEGGFVVEQAVFVNGTPPPKSDLAVEASDLTFTPSSPTHGDSVNLSATVRNLGSGNASSATVRFFDGDPAAGGALLGSFALGAVAANESASAWLSWTAVVGDHDIFIRVESVSPGDANLSNNTASKALTVVAPDLAVAEFSSTPAGPNIDNGTTLRLWANVTNLGPVQGRGNVTFYDGDPQSGGRLLGYEVVQLSGDGGSYFETSIEWVCGPSGWHTLFVEVRAVQPVDSNLTNNRASLLVYCREPDRPDLLVENLTFEPLSPYENETVTVRFTLRNEGAVAGTGTVHLYRGDPDTNGSELDERPVGLNASGTLQLQFIWQAPEGTHDLYILIDGVEPLDAVPDNNQANGTLTVRGYELELSTDRAVYEQGEQLQLWTNYTGHDRQLWVRLVQSNGSQLMSMVFYHPGQNTSFYTLPPDAPPGNYTLRANTSDAQAVTTFKVVPRTLHPDLAVNVTRMGLNVTGEPIVAGRTYKLHAVIENLGAADGNATLRFYDGDPLAEGVLIDEKEILVFAGNQGNFSVLWTPTTLGEHLLFARVEEVDPADENPLDNLAWIPVLVEPLYQPIDLELSLENVTWYPQAPREPAAVNIIANLSLLEGTGEVPARVRFYLNESGVNDTLLGEVELLVVEREGNHTAILKGWQPTAGLYHLVIVADNLTLPDTNLSNNRVEFDLEVKPPIPFPDLLVDGFIFSTMDLVEKEQVQVIVRVRNVGDRSAGGFTLAFSVGGREVHNVEVNGLAEGAFTDVTSTWKVNVGAGTHEITVTVDSLDQIPESNETNNQATLLFAVKQADDSWVPGWAGPGFPLGGSAGFVVFLAGFFGLAAVGATYTTERSRWWLYLLMALPLLSRVRKEELEKPDKFKAGRLYQTIMLNPGINLAALRDITGMPNGTLIYHLDRLVRGGEIRTHKQGQWRLFYPAEEALKAEREGGLRYMHRSQKRILQLLTDMSEANQRLIAQTLDMQQQLVSYHLRELLREGYVRRKGFRGFYIYTTEEKAAEALAAEA